MIKKLTIFVLALALLSPVVANAQLSYSDGVYDFGHIGIDFKLYHKFKFVNKTEQAVNILNAEVSCDCSSVKIVDSVINPGDTGWFDLEFITKDYYGPSNRSFTIKTDHTERKEFEYFYLAIVGQWFNGVKPKPISVFFLPGKKKQIVTIPNFVFDKLSLKDHLEYDDKLTVNVVKETANKNEELELEIIPSDNLKAGTYHTLTTVTVINSDDEETIISIPVKIVKY